MRLGSAFQLVIQIIVIVSVTFGTEPNGSIKGEVVSQRTQDPVVGAFVMVNGTSYGTITNASRVFQKIKRKVCKSRIYTGKSHRVFHKFKYPLP